jgi:hypothetical protein
LLFRHALAHSTLSAILQRRLLKQEARLLLELRQVSPSLFDQQQDTNVEEMVDQQQQQQQLLQQQQQQLMVKVNERLECMILEDQSDCELDPFDTVADVYDENDFLKLVWT